MHRISGWPDILFLRSGNRQDTGFDGRISGRIPDTSNNRISGRISCQSINRDHDNLLGFHQNIAVGFWQKKVSPFLSFERKILINLAL
jgi:hypothetical protein